MSSTSPPSNVASNLLTSDLHHLLLDLHTHHWPEVPNPPNCKKRASVACLIRIRPRYPDIPTHPPPLPSLSSTSEDDATFASQIEAFFSLPWAQRGTPEILFIKRAARRGDRWTSHVALPGGKRDPSDASDVAAAVRETMEEVGIDLSSTILASEGHPKPAESAHPQSQSSPQSAHPDPHGHGPEPPTSPNPSQDTTPKNHSPSSPFPPALLAGPLPQRLITTDFGAHPLMVLCPFVFLLTSPSPSSHALRLQPSEVGSAHWVPIRSLLDPGARTYERADLVDRLAVRWGLKWGGGLVRWGLRMALGRMLYGAVRLAPGESLYAEDGDPSVEGDSRGDRARGGGSWSGTGEPTQEDFLKRIVRVILDDAPWVQRVFAGTQDGDSADPRRSLLLWGLTQGIISDLLGLMPSRRDFTWWHWPVLSRPDIRFMTWLVSYRFRRGKLEALRRSSGDGNGGGVGGGKVPVLIEEGIGTVKGERAEEMVTGKKPGQEVDGKGVVKARATVFSAAGFVLDGYFEQAQRAIFITLFLRAVVGAAAAMYFWRRFARRRFTR